MDPHLPGRWPPGPAGDLAAARRGLPVTSTNALFGGFQYAVGGLLRMPLLLLPSLNSAGAEVGKPVTPQTTSVGVSTSSYVRREGEVIRHNFGWTLVILGYLIVIGVLYYYVLPGAMRL